MKELKVPHKILLAKPDAKVEIRMPEEKGVTISVGKIKLPRTLKADATIISTIGNEFNLRDLDKLSGLIVLDLQGFARTKKGRINFPPKNLQRIGVLKVTQSELKSLKLRDVQDQKKRILLVTKGAGGFKVFAKDKVYKFFAKKSKASDTLGAGDVLLTAFVAKFTKTHNLKTASRFALDYTTKFIETKSHG